VDLVSVGLVLASLVGVYVLLLGGLRRRPGAPGRAPFGRYRAVGSDRVGGVVLTVLAVLLTSGVESPAVAAGVALFLSIALVVGLRTAEPVVGLLMGGVGVVAATIAAARFVTDSGSGIPSQLFRVALVGIVLTAFVLTVVVFDRARGLAGHRGLALFGLVDIVVFIAGPGGADLMTLDVDRRMVIVVLAVVLAVVLGFGASAFLLTATAVMVTAAEVSLSVLDLSADESGVASVLGAAIAGAVAWRLA